MTGQIIDIEGLTEYELDPLDLFTGRVFVLLGESFHKRKTIVTATSLPSNLCRRSSRPALEKRSLIALASFSLPNNNRPTNRTTKQPRETSVVET